jgi:hypothetical protein
MHVQDLKRWHWAVIAVVVGLALSYVWSSVEWDENLPTIGQRDFEMGLVTKFPAEKHLDNVVVMPPEEGKYKIVAEQVRNTKTAGVIDLRPVAYMADTPYKAGQWQNQADEFPNVREYLKKLKENNPDVSYKYAWYRETWAIYTLWLGASILLIGGVWPSVVSLMVGAGLGITPEEKGPEYDLDRFKSEAEKKAAAPTAVDMQHLHELEDELEKKLAAQRAGMPIPEDQPEQAAAAVKKLDGGPLETAGPLKPGEEHEYKGEFYPVDRGAKKKGEK